MNIFIDFIRFSKGLMKFIISFYLDKSKLSDQGFYKIKKKVLEFCYNFNEYDQK